jgi:hypothetical protein
MDQINDFYYTGGDSPDLLDPEPGLQGWVDTPPVGGESDCESPGSATAWAQHILTEAAAGEGGSLTDSLLPSPGGCLDMARPSTVYRYGAAVQLSQRRIHERRAARRWDAERRSSWLEDSFFAVEVHAMALSHCPCPDPAVAERDDMEVGASALEWAEGVPDFKLAMGKFSAWLRGACIAVLPQEVLGQIYHEVWNLFCTTLLFPRTRSAFEAFIQSPVASPEAARFRLAGVGPVGPPPPPGISPLYEEWAVECWPFLTHDDVRDVESDSVVLLHFLGPVTQWVADAPVSVLPPALLGEVSLAAWELMIASLRIPRARNEFEYLCSDPPAMRGATGLSLFPSGASAALGEPTNRPHPRRRRRGLRC